MLSLVHTLQSFPPPLHHHPACRPTHKPNSLTHIPKKLITPHTLHTTLRIPNIIPRAAAADPGPDGSPDTAAAAEQVQNEQDSQPNTTNEHKAAAPEDSKPNSSESSSPTIAPAPAPVTKQEIEQAQAPAAPPEFDDEEEEEEEDEEEDPEVKSNPVAAGATNEKSDVKKGSTLQLAAVFVLWYAQNVIFNIYNKKVLNLFPYPWLLASFQLLVGSLWMAALWATGLQPRPRASRRFLAALAVPALFHAVGHISACVSFSHATVSFTHVIKAAEPAFSVVLSALHGTFYPVHVWLAVLPIIAGCSLAAVTEVSFSSAGLWGALISNVGFVLRNIYSKQSLYDFKHIDGLNLYGWISVVAFLYLFPVAVVVEGPQWVEGFRRAVAAVPTPWTFYAWVLLSGVLYHLYNQSSYQALDKISPLTFSVGNTMKRVVVIVASVLVFRNPITPLNALGSSMAIFGTFLYSQATAMGKNNKKNEVAEKKS